MASSSCGGTEATDRPPAAELIRVEAWRLSPVPEFMLPGVPLAGDTLFFGVLGPLGTFTRDGEIVLAIRERDDYRIVYVDSLGSGVRTFGGFGQGPGEFQRLTDLMMNGDTVAAWDWVNSRVSLFAGGQPAAFVPLPVPRSRTFVGLLDDGTIVVSPIWARIRAPLGSTAALIDAIPEGEPRPYHLMSRSGDSIGTLMGRPDPGSPNAAITLAAGDRPAGFLNFGRHCWPEALHATVGGRLLIGDAREGGLYWMDRDGSTERLYASSYRDTVHQDQVDRVTGYIERNERESGALTAESKAALLARAGRAGDPGHAVWSAMVVSLDGDVWLERANCHGASNPEEIGAWEVVGPDGALRATVAVPGNVTVLAVDGSRVLAVVKDELEVQHLALYRLVR